MKSKERLEALCAGKTLVHKVEGVLFIKDCPADFYLNPTELKSKWRKWSNE